MSDSRREKAIKEAIDNIVNIHFWQEWKDFKEWMWENDPEKLTFKQFKKIAKQHTLYHLIVLSDYENLNNMLLDVWKEMYEDLKTQSEIEPESGSESESD
jgi:hypothetical protein